MTIATQADQIAKDILADMSLKEKTAIANLEKEDVVYLQYAFDLCVGGQLGEDEDLGTNVMHRIWEILQESHRIRCVKKPPKCSGLA